MFWYVPGISGAVGVSIPTANKRVCTIGAGQMLASTVSVNARLTCLGLRPPSVCRERTATAVPTGNPRGPTSVFAAPPAEPPPAPPAVAPPALPPAVAPPALPPAVAPPALPPAV